MSEELRTKTINDMDQREIVKQRLTYHFKNTDGSWNSPEGMPFMKEFLDEVEKLANSYDSIDHVSGSCLPKCTRVEVIDNSGRAYTNYDCKSVDTQMQDEERTLKVFIS